MAASIKPSPVLKGNDAKKFKELMNKPNNNAEFFKRCKESAQKNFRRD